MYSSAVVATSRYTLEQQLREVFPRGLVEYSVDDVAEFREERFKGLFDKKGHRTRSLTKEEDLFVLNEQILGKVSYEYWAQRYCVINLKGQTTGPMYPLFESQILILAELGRIEEERAASGHPDGICVDVLKARQLGASTLAQSILAHRLTTASNIFGLLASDVPDSSDFLWDMFERVYDHLDWWMRPTTVERVKNDEMVFGTGSRLFWGASKSTRGADKSKRGSSDGQKGQLGRGKTLSVVHQSEVATWTNPSQIDTSLEPAIAVSPQTFWLKESTAQGRGGRNYWYQEWQLAKSGRSRATGIFIPWYAERSKYSLPAPVDWSPSEDTMAHARRAEEHGPRWMHRSVRLTRNQLYWYERTRYEKTEKGLLAEFLQEYPADDEEAFQHSGVQNVMRAEDMERLRNQARPLGTLVEIAPQRELTKSGPAGSGASA